MPYGEVFVLPSVHLCPSVRLCVNQCAAVSSRSLARRRSRHEGSAWKRIHDRAERAECGTKETGFVGLAIVVAVGGSVIVAMATGRFA